MVKRQVTALALALLGVTLLLVVPLGCSKGEYIPLVGPGVSSDWPADPGWLLAPSVFGGRFVYGGAWSGEDSLLVLVGSAGAAFEHANGQWSRVAIDTRLALRSVISLGAGEFIAVGDRGLASRRTGGHWVTEETGTDQNLNRIVTAGAEVWALGEQGTVRHRTVAGWEGLPAPGTDDVLSGAVLNDTLFVTTDGDSSQIRVWEGTAWGTVSPGPWAGRAVRGVVATPTGRLLAAADSLYERGPYGWRAVRPENFLPEWTHYFDSVVVGHTLWIRYGSWFRFDLLDPDGPLSGWVPLSRSVLVPLGDEDFLTGYFSGALYWVRSGEERQDPAGNVDLGAEIKLASGGPLFFGGPGVLRWDGAGLQTVLPANLIPDYWWEGDWRGCGRSESDFYLTRNGTVFHYQGGQLLTVGSVVDEMDPNSMALTEAGVLYLASRRGLWRWTGVNWERQLPAMADQEGSFNVWPDGNGSLVARGPQGAFHRLQGDLWLPLGQLSRDGILLAAADGTLVGVQPNNGSVDYEGGNELLVYDEKAAAFRTLWGRGMGIMQNQGLGGGTSRDGELLIWTSRPSMVFRLNGPPSAADWELVAGPVDADIRALIRLTGGELLALDQGDDRFYLYRD